MMLDATFKKTVLFGVLLAIGASCAPNYPEPEYEQPYSANFKKTVRDTPQQTTGASYLLALDKNGVRLANTACELEGDGFRVKMVTDQNGSAKFRSPVFATNPGLADLTCAVDGKNVTRSVRAINQDRMKRTQIVSHFGGITEIRSKPYADLTDEIGDSWAYSSIDFRV